MYVPVNTARNETGLRREFPSPSAEELLLKFNGKGEKKIVFLEKPYEGLYIPNDMWREMYDFSEDAVLLVLASEIYQEGDYIRNYEEFLDFVSSKGGTHS